MTQSTVKLGGKIKRQKSPHLIRFQPQTTINDTEAWRSRDFDYSSSCNLSGYVITHLCYSNRNIKGYPIFIVLNQDVGITCDWNFDKVERKRWLCDLYGVLYFLIYSTIGLGSTENHHPITLMFYMWPVDDKLVLVRGIGKQD